MVIRARVEPPAPGPLRRGLLAPGGGIAITEDTDRWQGGIAWSPFTCAALTPRPIVCDEDTEGLDAKETPDNSATVEYDPVYLLGGDYCSTMDNGRNRVERARINLQVTESHQLEQELWDGVASRLKTDPEPNAYLAKADGAEVLSDDPVPFTNALAELELAMADCLHGQQGMVHATVATFDLWWSAGLLRLEGQRVFTPMDNIVIVGSGYSGSAPGADPGDDPVPPDDPAVEANAYGTALVYTRLGPVVEVGDRGSQIARATNDWRIFVERAAAATFDPCCWFTIPVDHTTDLYANVAAP